MGLSKTIENLQKYFILFTFEKLKQTMSRSSHLAQRSQKFPIRFVVIIIVTSLCSLSLDNKTNVGIRASPSARNKHAGN